MHESGKKLLSLMFRQGETVCVSHNKYGYHSIPLEKALDGELTMVSPNPDYEFEKIKSTDVKLVALNPIKGFREDLNCTAFRNFMVEMDYGPLKEQLEYAQKIGLPYSACVFSGSKSLHFLISVDQDLPSEKVWRMFAEWILNVATAADPNTKNPSRGLRVAGAEREPGKKQVMVDWRGQTKLADLVAWLSKYPGAKPKEPEKRVISGTADFSKLKPWVPQRLANGLRSDQGRNKQWFSIACEFALAGYSEDDTIEMLTEYFNPDRDFKEREWLTSIKSAFKYIYARK